MNRRAQVWIETVIYTLIGISLIALALAFLSPKISSEQEKILIEQSIGSLKILDDKIIDISLRGEGNKGIISEFSLKQGELEIDATNNLIKIKLENLKSEYSESGKSINYGGRISISTTKGQKYFNTELTIAYNQNLLYEGIDQTKRFTASPTPYKFSIENVGGEINIKELSL